MRLTAARQQLRAREMMWRQMRVCAFLPGRGMWWRLVHSLAARHWAVGLHAALGVQGEKAPHLLAVRASPCDLELAVHSVLEQRPHFAAAAAAAVAVLAAAGVLQQLHGALQLHLALVALHLSQARARLIHLAVASGLQGRLGGGGGHTAAAQGKQPAARQEAPQAAHGMRMPTKNSRPCH